MSTRLILGLTVLALSFGCKPSTQTESQRTATDSIQTLTPKYARFFDVQIKKEGTLLRIFNPWKKGALLQEFLITKEGQKGQIQAPIKSLIPMSTSFYGYIEKFNALDKIIAIENKDFVYNPTLDGRIKSGELTEIGQSGNISIEKTVLLRPSVLVISGTELLGPNLLKIQQSGIPIVNNMDWQEQHPLGRAEWIKVFGILFDQEKLADSLFTEIEKRYNEVRDKVKQQIPTEKVDVVLGYNYQGTWFLPGGRSYVGQYLRDAGANYAFDKDTSTGSIPLASELAFNKFANARVWLNPGLCRTKQELLNLDRRYNKLGAYINSRVYNNNQRSNMAGGNDFWENSPSNPDIVLKDLVKIFYPELLPEHKLYFYQQLN